MDFTSHPLYGTLFTLAGQPRPDGRAKIIALTSPYAGVGTSYVARQLALLAAQFYQPQGQRVALVDYDLDQQTQGAFFEAEARQKQYGALTGPFDLTFGQTPFWQVSPSVLDEAGNRIRSSAYAATYLVGDTGLAISRFDWAQIRTGQQVHVRDAPGHWDVLRDQFGLIIVDTPSFDRSDNGIHLFPLADACALVCDMYRSRETALKEFGDKIISIGGQCAGTIINAGPPAASNPAAGVATTAS